MFVCLWGHLAKQVWVICKARCGLWGGPSPPYRLLAGLPEGLPFQGCPGVSQGVRGLVSWPNAPRALSLQTRGVGAPGLLPREAVPLSLSRRLTLGDSTPQHNALPWVGHTAPGSRDFPAQRCRNWALKGRLVPSPQWVGN